MRKKNSNRLFYIIGGGIIILILVGAVIIFFVNKNRKSSLNNTSPSEKNSSPNPNDKLSEQEIEKYLLEKRLDLQKYFVFNLGELKTKQQEPTAALNWWVVNAKLLTHLTLLTVSYEKELTKKGYEVVGRKINKNLVCFLVKGKEWSGENLDQKIVNGKDKYVVIEKDYDYPHACFDTSEPDKKGKIKLTWTNIFQIRMEHLATHICESKEKALEIIKTDPTLQGKI